MKAARVDVCDLKYQLEELREKVVATEELVSANMAAFFDGNPKYIIFISFSDGKSRACVCKGIGNAMEASWKNALDLMQKKVKALKLNPIWIKVDVVQDIRGYPYNSFLDYVSQIKTNYFREGMALDKMFNVAFLEQEINANVFLYGTKELPQKQIVWKNVNFYIKNNLGMRYKLKEDSVKNIYTFQTIGFFHDGTQCHTLNNGWLDHGIRFTSKLDRELLRSIIEESSDYLSDQVDSKGKFRYGYFPCFDKEIETYNILRHASTTYAMIEAYEITKDAKLEKAVKLALDYLVNEGVEIIEESPGKSRAFVVERVAGNEIKLGANAAALLALSKYTTAFHDQKYIEVMENLAEGIEYFQNKQDGSFVHVLNFPELTIKEKHRIVYYNGEAAFALMRFYDINRNERWLKMVEQAFENFIQKRYWRHHDHWLSYCSYELVKHKPEKKYIEFNLQNAGGILDFCLTRETTYPTLLELLMATYSMIEKLKKDDLYLETLTDIDEEKLIRAIEHRAQHQLTGLFYPELAMYYKAPRKIVGSFFIRHHSFRVRIDDIEHNLSGYCSYYHQRLNGS